MDVEKREPFPHMPWIFTAVKQHFATLIFQWNVTEWNALAGGWHRAKCCIALMVKAKAVHPDWRVKCWCRAWEMAGSAWFCQGNGWISHLVPASVPLMQWHQCPVVGDNLSPLRMKLLHKALYVERCFLGRMVCNSCVKPHLSILAIFWCSFFIFIFTYTGIYFIQRCPIYGHCFYIWKWSMVGSHLIPSHSAGDRILYMGKKERSGSKGMTLKFSEAFNSERPLVRSLTYSSFTSVCLTLCTAGRVGYVANSTCAWCVIWDLTEL